MEEIILVFGSSEYYLVMCTGFRCAKSVENSPPGVRKEANEEKNREL